MDTSLTSADDQSNQRSKELNDHNFIETVMNSQHPVLIDFWAPWCAPCRLLTPILTEIELEFQDRLIVAKMNVDENPDITTRLGIQSIPTLALFEKENATVISIGAQSKQMLVTLINRALVQLSETKRQ